MKKLTYLILIGIIVLSIILTLTEKTNGMVTLSAAGAIAVGGSLFLYVKKNKAKLQKSILRELSHGKR